MKIIVKTLNGKQLPLDIEGDWSVRKVKEAMESTHDLKADTLKLIAYGKVLDKDENAVSTYSIKEGDFIVAMVQKAKPVKAAPKAPTEEVKKEEEQAKPTEAAATNPPASTQPAAESQPAATNPPAQTQPVAAQSQPAQAQPAAELSPQVEAAINELMAISGQPKELCVRALTAAQGIPDVAFEFLLSGQIPEVPLGGGDAGLDDGYGDEEMVDGEEGVEGGAGAGAAGLGQYNLDPSTLQAIQTLVSNPNFDMIRQRMVSDPNFSQQFMQQLQQTQPAIFNAIQSNPGILMSLILGHDPLSGAMGGARQAAGGQPGAMPGMGQAQPNPGQIQVSATELEAINRLASLGFAKSRAAEAYFACDKNEELAANFLFEAGAEDEDTATQNAIAASQQQIVGGANAEADAQAQPNPAENQNAAAEQNPAEGGQEQQNQDQQNNDSKPEDQNNNNGGDGAGAGEGGGSSLI